QRRRLCHRRTSRSRRGTLANWIVQRDGRCAKASARGRARLVRPISRSRRVFYAADKRRRARAADPVLGRLGGGVRALSEMTKCDWERETAKRASQFFCRHARLLLAWRFALSFQNNHGGFTNCCSAQPMMNTKTPTAESESDSFKSSFSATLPEIAIGRINNPANCKKRAMRYTIES